MAQQRCQEDYMRKCRSIILPWNVSEHIRKPKREQNKSKHSRTSTPDLHPPPATRLRWGSSFFSAWLDLSQRCHWQSSLYLWLLLYVRVSPERGTHKLCSLLGSGLAETDRIDWWVGMGTRRESERCPQARWVWYEQQAQEEGEWEAGTVDPTLELSLGLWLVQLCSKLQLLRSELVTQGGVTSTGGNPALRWTQGRALEELKHLRES